MPDHDLSYRQVLQERHEAILVKLGEIVELQKLTNGRVRAAEKAIAVLQFAYLVGAFVIGGAVTALLADWVQRR